MESREDIAYFGYKHINMSILFVVIYFAIQNQGYLILWRFLFLLTGPTALTWQSVRFGACRSRANPGSSQT